MIPFLRAALIGALICLLAMAATLFIYAASGNYDIAADAPHEPLTLRLIEAVRDRSIQARAASVDAAALPADPAAIALGARHYAEMCTGCHLAPGMHDTELRAGLYPQPPKLAEEPPLSPPEQFWIIKHGVKLTAMPAWGATHDDAAIWAMVAFVRQLPQMSPEQYQELTAGPGASPSPHAHVHHHDH